MASQLLAFFVGLTLGFALSAIWVFRRKRRSDAEFEPIVDIADSPPPVKDSGTAEQSDGAIKDADQRMAYGEYAAAAEIIEAQIGEDSANTRLKEKLLEIYFVSGHEDRFLAVFRQYEDELRQSRAWNKLCGMGAQLFPDEPLFSDA